MSELNKEELLAWLDEKVDNYSEQAYLQIKEMIHHQGIDEAWLPTPENINALPEPVRKFIHNLETNVDPQGMVRENVLIKDTCKALVIKLEEKKKTVTNKWIEERTMEMIDIVSKGKILESMSFIRSLVNEIGK